MTPIQDDQSEIDHDDAMLMAVLVQGLRLIQMRNSSLVWMMLLLLLLSDRD